VRAFFRLGGFFALGFFPVVMPSAFSVLSPLSAGAGRVFGFFSASAVMPSSVAGAALGRTGFLSGPAAVMPSPAGLATDAASSALRGG